MTKKVIQVQNLSKRYRLGLKEKQENTLAGQIANVIKTPWQNLKRLRELNRFEVEDDSVFWALKDVSFDVMEGEVLGIIGKNGAGKSTLLKILSQITEPTSGKIEIHGRVASLLEVGTGFHPELSGRENIYMNGTILGMTRREIDSKLDEIIDFSGIEKFIDTPVKFYSSGMKVRLGFSVAAHLDPEILIIDEVLAVGDYEFQKKCLGKMENVSKNEGRTVLFVSHNMGAVSHLCKKSILLNKGKLNFIGSTNLCVDKYFTHNENNQKALGENENFTIDDFFLSNKTGRKVDVIPHNVDWIIEFSFLSKVKIESCIVSLVIFSSEGQKISTIHVKPFKVRLGSNYIKVNIEGGRLAPSSFYFYLDIHDQYKSYFVVDRLYDFSIFDNGSEFYKWNGQNIGKVFLKYTY